MYPLDATVRDTAEECGRSHVPAKQTGRSNVQFLRRRHGEFRSRELDWKAACGVALKTTNHPALPTEGDVASGRVESAEALIRGCTRRAGWSRRTLYSYRRGMRHDRADRGVCAARGVHAAASMACWGFSGLRMSV